MKKVLSVLFLLATVFCFAQQKNFGNIKNVSPSSLRPISIKNELKGYYLVYRLDKVDKKNDLYQIEILDLNMQTTHKINMQKPRGSFSTGGYFNGDVFCFTFLKSDFYSMDYEIIGQDGKPITSYKINPKANKQIPSYTSQPVQGGGSGYSSGLFPIPHKGFLRGYTDDKRRTQSFELFDNTGKKVWSIAPGNSNPKDYEAGTIQFANEKYAVIAFSSRPKMMSAKGSKTETLIIDIKTGKILGRTALSNTKYYLSEYGVSYDEFKDEFHLYGEYYGLKKNGKLDIHNKLGFFSKVVKPTGSKVKDHFVSYSVDIAKKIPADQRKKVLDKMSLFVHEMIFTESGKIYAVAEQYKKVVSGSGVAVKALGSVLSTATGGAATASASAFSIQLHDMMVFEFTPSMQVSKVHTIEKKMTSLNLPEGYGINSEDRLGYFIKAYGWFDYEYTTVSKDKKQFNVVYINYDKTIKKKKENTSKYVVGYIGLNDDQKLTSGIFKINGRPTWYRAVPAKPGYLAIFEYYKKEKKLTSRLEKLDL